MLEELIGRDVLYEVAKLQANLNFDRISLTIHKLPAIIGLHHKKG